MPKHDSKPSGPQLGYLCQLAERTGTTFPAAADPPAGERGDRAAQTALPLLPASNDRQTARPPKSLDEAAVVIAAV